MAQTKRDVEIMLKARDAYSVEFDKLQGRIGGVRAAATKGMGETSSAVDQLARAFRAFGAGQGIFSSATAAVSIFKGDMQSAVDALKQLPFGIGGATRAMDEFGRSILGVTAAEEKLKNAQADLLAQQKQLADRRREVAANDNTIEQISRKVRDAFELESTPEADREGTMGFTRRLKELRQEQQAAIDQLDELQKKRLTVAQEREIQETRKLVYRLFGIRESALYWQQQAEIKAIRDREEAEKTSLEERLNLVRDAIRRQAFDQREELNRAAEGASQTARRSISAGSEGLEAFESRFLTRAPARFMTEANSREAQRIDELKQIMSQSRDVAMQQLAALEKIERGATFLKVENN